MSGVSEQHVHVPVSAYRLVSCLRLHALARTRSIGSSFRRMLTACFPFMDCAKSIICSLKIHFVILKYIPRYGFSEARHILSSHDHIGGFDDSDSLWKLIDELFLADSVLRFHIFIVLHLKMPSSAFGPKKNSSPRDSINKSASIAHSCAMRL